MRRIIPAPLLRPCLEIVETSLPGVLLIKPRVFQRLAWVLHGNLPRRCAGCRRRARASSCRTTTPTLPGRAARLALSTCATPQAKLCRVVQGEVLDVAVDIRVGSPNFGKWVGAVLSAENRHALYFPQGFAHGFVVRSETADFLYKCSDYYDATDDCGVLWNDPALAIDWDSLRRFSLPRISVICRSPRFRATVCPCTSHEPAPAHHREHRTNRMAVAAHPGAARRCDPPARAAQLDLDRSGERQRNSSATSRPTSSSTPPPTRQSTRPRVNPIGAHRQCGNPGTHRRGAGPHWRPADSLLDRLRLRWRQDRPVRRGLIPPLRSTFTVAPNSPGSRLIAASGCAHIILRTTWVYDIRGKNFLRTVLRLAREREELRMVGDQHGAPTWARAIAEATAQIVARCARQRAMRRLGITQASSTSPRLARRRGLALLSRF